MNLFDIVIPVGPNDINQLNKQLEYTKINIIGYRNIYIIPSKSLELELELEQKNCIIISENIFPFTIEDIALHNNEKLYNNSKRRDGWYLQQLLKLYAGFIIPDILDKWLVIDCDTFFIKPTQFIDNHLLLYNPGKEQYYEPYFQHMKKLIPELDRQINRISGISHHMIFEKKYIKEIIDLIEINHKEKFWILFMKFLNPEGNSGASEYELYFNYMLKYNKDKIKIRRLNWTDSSVFKDNTNLDYISVHWYMRPK